MYWKVPTMVPCCVTGVVRVTAVVKVAPGASGAAALARPNRAASRRTFVIMMLPALDRGERYPGDAPYPVRRRFPLRTSILARAAPDLLQQLRQCFSFEILHDQEFSAILMADIIERANVRMIQAGDSFRFLLERCRNVGSLERWEGRILTATVRSSAYRARDRLRPYASAKRRDIS